MNFFAKTTLAKIPKTKDSEKAAYLYAAILVIFAISQLFTFDEFLNLLTSFCLPGGEPIARLIGSLIVISEVFALPFLLQMRLSYLMRFISMVLSWAVPLIWLSLGLWFNLTSNFVSNVGILGSKITLVPGWWLVSLVIAFGLLSAWVSWGLWPTKRLGNANKRG